MNSPFMLVLLCIAGCTRAAQQLPEPRDPALSHAANASAPIRVELNADAQLVSVPCTGEESDEPNGIDDNCDGHIDADHNESTLAVSIAHDPRQDLSIDVYESDTRMTPSSEDEVGACDASRAFAVRTASFAKLPPGSYKVVITRGTRCSSDEVKFAHVSLAAKGEAPVRVGRPLEPGSGMSVATIVVP